MTRYDWDDTSHMTGQWFYILYWKTYTEGLMTEQKMVCCVATGPLINSFFLVGWAAWKRQAEVKHKTFLISLPWAEIEPLTRRSWRSIRASFIWMVLFFGDFQPILALDFHKVTRWQTKATSAHRNGQTNKEIAVYSRRYSDVQTFKQRKQWILVLTDYKWGFCASRRLYEHSTLQSSSFKIKTGQRKADKDLVH